MAAYCVQRAMRGMRKRPWVSICREKKIKSLQPYDALRWNTLNWQSLRSRLLVKIHQLRGMDLTDTPQQCGRDRHSFKSLWSSFFFFFKAISIPQLSKPCILEATELYELSHGYLNQPLQTIFRGEERHVRCGLLRCENTTLSPSPLIFFCLQSNAAA